MIRGPKPFISLYKKGAACKFARLGLLAGVDFLKVQDFGEKEALDVRLLVQNSLLDLVRDERLEGPPGGAFG